MLLCLASLLATAIGSAAVIASLRLSRVSIMVTGFWVILTGQLVAETLVVGGVLRQLNPTALAAAAVAVAMAEVAGCYRFARAAARASIGHVRRVLAYGLGRVWRHPVLLALALLVVAQYAWQIALTVQLPHVSYDGLQYHLIGPDTWIQHGAIVHSKQNLYADVYPADQDLLTAWVGTFLHTLRYAGLTTLPFVALAGSTVVMLARNLKVRTSLAVLGGLGFVALPAVFLQASTAYVDIAGGATALAALGFVLIVTRSVTFDHGTARGLAGHMLLAGTATGLAAGIKSTNLVIVAAVVLTAFIQFVRVTDVRPELPERTIRPRGRVGAACLLVPAAALSGFWYIRTWVTWGSPFYPVTVLGFRGTGSTARVIIGPNKPAQLRHVPLGPLGAVVTSWLYDLHRHAYIYDQRLGGFGLQWPIFVVPAVVLATVWFARHRPSYLWGLLVPVVAVAVASAAPWWARYTIALAGAGCVCLALCLEHLATGAGWRPGGRRRARGAVSLITVGFVTATGVSMWWATSPTGYLLMENGALHYGTAQEVRHLMTLPNPESVVSPWWDYTDLDTVVPAGSTIAIVADNVPFTDPLVGQDLQRRLVVVGSPATASALAADMARARARFVFLMPTVAVAPLSASIAADRRFLPVAANLFETGTWPTCVNPTLTIVDSSLDAGGVFRVTGSFTDSCGTAAGEVIELWQGDRRLPLYQGSDKAITRQATAADGTVSFTVTGSPPIARYFLRAESQSSGRGFHGLTVSRVLNPTPAKG